MIMSNKKEKKISYKLIDAALSFATKQATCKLRIPSDNLPRYGNSVDCPTSRLVVKDLQNIHCIEMMRGCEHKNILHALVVIETTEGFAVWSVSFTDSVWNYLESTALGLRFTNTKLRSNILLPTANLQSFISQVFDGLQYLWARGKYHGNFKLENTYYYEASLRERIVKLMCFKLKEERAGKQCMAEDCQDVGVALKIISQSAVALNAKNYSFDCYIIDDLSERLQKFTRADLYFIKQDILDHPFFWNCKEIKTFFISEIPIALNDPVFRTAVEGCEELCDCPWNKSYGGFLQVMIDYRARRNIPAYDFNSRVNYVQFLSGLYAHEKELMVIESVDKIVRSTNPRVYMILYKLVPRVPRPANPGAGGC